MSTTPNELTHSGEEAPDALTSQYLAECEAEVEGAGPGPFTVQHGVHGVQVLDGDGDAVAYMVGGEVCFPENLGVFFASARQRIPVLIAEVRRLGRLLAQARGNHLAAGDPFVVHPVHPGYGPCDGMAPGHMCSVCLETMEGLHADRQRLAVALRPFAAVHVTGWAGTAWEGAPADKVVLVHARTGTEVTVGDFAAAAAALPSDTVPVPVEATHGNG